MNVIMIFLGMFLDLPAAVLLLTPIFVPLAASVGMDTVQLGIMMVVNLAMGLYTPPVGTTLFIASSVAKVPMGEVVKEMMPFYARGAAGAVPDELLPDVHPPLSRVGRHASNDEERAAMSTIGFVGLGAMGAPMARNLLASGFEVRGFDVRAERPRRPGGRPAGRGPGRLPRRERGRHAPPHGGQRRPGRSRAVRRWCAGRLPPAVTCDPDGDLPAGCRRRPSPTRVETAGRRFVDAPVSGGVAGAQKGALSIMAAAPKADLRGRPGPSSRRWATRSSMSASGRARGPP